MTTNFHVDGLIFGEVLEVDGMAVTVLARDLRRSHDSVEYAVELGAFVLIQAPQSDLIATISTIQLESEQTRNEAPTERRIVRCTLVGLLRAGTIFERGIERYPTIGSKVAMSRR